MACQDTRMYVSVFLLMWVHAFVAKILWEDYLDQTSGGIAWWGRDMRSGNPGQVRIMILETYATIPEAKSAGADQHLDNRAIWGVKS